MRTLDRYLIREILPPFLLALGLFTFVLAINPMLDHAKDLLAKGLPAPTVGWLLVLLIPQALSLTIPMAFLTGLLMALGRVSGDRESVALLSCGVSPLRLLRPVVVLAVIVAGFDMYVLMKLKPDSNQSWREITFGHLEKQTATEIKPQVFFEKFPNMVLFIGGTNPDGTWSEVMLADTTDAARPTVMLADTGRLAIDRDRQQVGLVLGNATRYEPGRSDPRVYNTATWNPAVVSVSAASMFGSGIAYDRGFPEMGYRDLKALEAKHRAEGVSTHNEVLHMQQMFSFPVACVVFAILGVPVALNTRKEGRLAALAVGLAIIASYYLLMEVAEGWVKGEAWKGGPAFPAEWARWVPNIVLGLLGVAALWRSSRTGNARPLLTAPAWLRRGPEAPAAGARDGGSRPAVVSRQRLIGIPLPRLLDRYVGQQYLRMVGLSFIALLTLYYIGAIVDLAEKVFKGQAGTMMVLQYLWYSTPEFISFVIPIATLVAVLGTIGALTRSGELMVMRASGVSLYRAALPLLLFALVWGGVLFVLEDRVLGASRKTAMTLRDTLRGRGQIANTVEGSNLTWMVGQDGRLYHYAGFENASRLNSGRPAIHALSVFGTAAKPYRLTEHTFAERVDLKDGAWQAVNGWSQSFAATSVSREDFTSRTLAIAPVEDFRRAHVDASAMSYTQLREYVKRVGASGFNVAEQAVDLQHKLAFPAVTIVMTLLAIPFGATTGKKGALYGVGLAAVLAGAYFLVLTLSLAAGAAGVLPPALAAWAPNLIFASGALFLMFTVRT